MPDPLTELAIRWSAVAHSEYPGTPRREIDAVARAIVDRAVVLAMGSRLPALEIADALVNWTINHHFLGRTHCRLIEILADLPADLAALGVIRMSAGQISPAEMNALLSKSIEGK